MSEFERNGSLCGPSLSRKWDTCMPIGLSHSGNVSASVEPRIVGVVSVSSMLIATDAVDVRSQQCIEVHCKEG